MRTNPAQYTFAAGEVSPLLYGRPDYQRVQSGLRRCRGFVPLRQGGITRAPGTWYRGATRNNAGARLIAFRFSAEDSVVLEFSAFRMRVWRYGALVMDGGSPYELTTPWDLAAVWRLRWQQSADVIYLVDGVLRPYKLSRFALDNWTLGWNLFTRGPFGLENVDEAVTIQASAETGTGITLTGVGSPFVAGHVGASFSLRVANDVTVPTWVGNQAVTDGDRRRYDGRIYTVISGTNSGVNPPVHRAGRRKVSVDGPVWEFTSDEVGIVTITAVANANSATANVVKRLPRAVITEGTFRFAESQFSDKEGWPSAVTIYDQRLVFAGTPTNPRTLWFSAIGDFTNFEPSVEPDGAFTYGIAGGSAVSRILWLAAGSRALHIGALGEEWSSRAGGDLEALGPLNATFRLDSSIGASSASPVVPDGKPVFIARDKGRLFELRYSFEEDGNRAIELSLPSEHLGAEGFEEIVWTGAPLRLGWLRRTTGDLALVVHDPAEDVLGWALHSLAGGVVESLCVSGDATGREDVVTMVVRRTIDGDTVRHVEELARFYGVLTGADGVETANHLFASVVKAEVSPFTSVTGLGHLEGETVRVWSEQGDLGDHVVESGAITLADPVTRATVGLFDTAHMIETLDVPAQVREGASLGRQKRVKAIGLRWHRTAAAEVRAIEREFAVPDIEGAWVDATRMPVPRDLVEVFDGVINVNAPSGHAKEVTVQARPVGGAPMTLLAAVPIVDAAGG